MFDLGWSKLIIIAIVAIVVVGPKDLPPLLRAIGKFLTQMRRQAEEFRSQFNEAMKDTGLDEIRRDVEGIKSTAQGAAYDIGRSMEESTRPLNDAVSEIERAGSASAAAVTGSNGYVNGAGAAHATPDAEAAGGETAKPLSPIAAAAAAAAEAAPASSDGKGT